MTSCNIMTRTINIKRIRKIVWFFFCFFFSQESFDNLFQQDAHEFLNYLLNTCADILKEEMKELRRLEEVTRQAAENHGHCLKSNRLLSSKPMNGNTGSGHMFNRNSSTNSSNRSISSKNSVSSKANNNQTDTTAEYKPTNGAETDTAGTSGSIKEELTWIHELFQGILVNETKCLNCETVKNLIFIFCIFLGGGWHLWT